MANNDPIHYICCDVWSSNDYHICLNYNDKPCRTCGEPTIFVTIAAPGYGSGWECRQRHYEAREEIGELTAEQVR